VISLREDLNACFGWKFRYLPQKRLLLQGLRRREQVDQNLAACRDFASLEGLDAVVPNEID